MNKAEKKIAIDKFFHLRRAGGKAPHKPILLLSIIQLITEGEIYRNRIFITPELVGTFQKLWLKLVSTKNWQPRFFLPFFHLSGDKFWHLKLSDGAKVALTSSYSPKSLSSLKDSIQYAWLDEDIFELLKIPEDRATIKRLLLKKYFPKCNFEEINLRKERQDYINQLELDFLSGQAATAANKYYRITQTEARSVVFKTVVPKKYKYTCAISGQHLSATADIQMIDACHIKPWSESKDDSIQNGLTLSPTLHRAFDRHFISIDSEYKVILSKSFSEDLKSSFNLSQFEGKRILLPDQPDWYPSQDALAWHRSKLL